MARLYNLIRNAKESWDEMVNYYHPKEPLAYRSVRKILRNWKLLATSVIFGVGCHLQNLHTTKLIENLLDEPVGMERAGDIYLEGIEDGIDIGFERGKIVGFLSFKSYLKREQEKKEGITRGLNQDDSGLEI